MKTEQVRYVGPYDEVELVVPPSADNPYGLSRSLVIEHGETAEVPMSIAENLVAQETWEYTGDGPAEGGATDSAEELAQSLGIDLDNVEGTGKDGRVTKADVEAAAEPAGDDEDSSAQPGEED